MQWQHVQTAPEHQAMHGKSDPTLHASRFRTCASSSGGERSLGSSGLGPNMEARSELKRLCQPGLPWEYLWSNWRARHASTKEINEMYRHVSDGCSCWTCFSESFLRASIGLFDSLRMPQDLCSRQNASLRSESLLSTSADPGYKACAPCRILLTSGCALFSPHSLALFSAWHLAMRQWESSFSNKAPARSRGASTARSPPPSNSKGFSWIQLIQVSCCPSVALTCPHLPSVTFTCTCSQLPSVALRGMYSNFLEISRYRNSALLQTRHRSHKIKINFFHHH